MEIYALFSALDLNEFIKKIVFEDGFEITIKFPKNHDCSSIVIFCLTKKT